MERVELLVALEHELGADVDEDTVSQIYTVRELVEAVRAAMGSGGAKLGFRGWDAVLAEAPTESHILDAIQAKPLLTRAWFLFGRLVNLFTRDLFHLDVTGLEKLPKAGPYIISPNHQSFLDAPILVATFPWHVYRKLFFVGTSEIFGAGPAKYLARSIKLVAVDPDANLVPAMRAGAFGLKRGNILVLFPEGERSIDGTPRTFKKGAAILATHLRVPIVPVAMDGFFEAWPRGASFFRRFTRMKIAIGDPVPPPEPGPNPEQTYATLTRELKSRVMEMWNELHGDTASDSHAAAAD
jgi:long-chain acyl-CoA synthetase